MNLNPLFPTDDTLGLNTDLYELTMAAGYFESGRAEELATFELFTRRLPNARNFLIAAGLEQALHYALNVGYSDETIAYLRKLGVFKDVSPRFFEYLGKLRFSGDIWALPEGTVFFEGEPIVQVTAPIVQAQLLETYFINVINVQSMIASKAARMCLAARGRWVVDFGSRRAHGPQTGVLAARAAFVGGCDGTSNVLAGYEMGVPVFGTMAHSFVQFFEHETEAFEWFKKVFPDNTILLVDTYDALEGLKRAVGLSGDFVGIRLDSGDLGALSLKARRILDEAGRRDAQIFVSGNLNEEKLLMFSLQDLPINGYGVGTDLVVSSDAPTCDLVYKLVEVGDKETASPRFKASERKATHPHRKQVFRSIQDGEYKKDLIAKWDEEINEGTPLLRPFVKDGELVTKLPTVERIREEVLDHLGQLPTRYKHLHSTEWYPVSFSPTLEKSMSRLRARPRR